MEILFYLIWILVLIITISKKKIQIEKVVNFACIYIKTQFIYLNYDLTFYLNEIQLISKFIIESANIFNCVSNWILEKLCPWLTKLHFLIWTESEEDRHLIIIYKCFLSNLVYIQKTVWMDMDQVCGITTIKYTQLGFLSIRSMSRKAIFLDSD